MRGHWTVLKHIIFFTFGTCWYFHFSLIVICLYFLILLNQKAIVNCKGSQKDPTQSLVFLQYSSYVLNSWVRCASGNVCFFLLLVVVFSTLGPLWFCVIIFFAIFGTTHLFSTYMKEGREQLHRIQTNPWLGLNLVQFLTRVPTQFKPGQVLKSQNTLITKMFGIICTYYKHLHIL